jgi:uncharacterized SAM-binding protein YcdF (DUF218 family)
VRVIAPVVALAAVAAAFLLAGRVLVVADPLPASADAIVIMAGSVSDRVLEAADLYHAGIAPRVIVTRERRRPGEHRLRARGVILPENDDLTLTALHGLGVPPNAILRLRRRASNTASEARVIARHACRRRFRQLIVVTSRAHTRRARLILRRALAPAVQVAVRPSRHDPFRARCWWRFRQDAKVVWREYQQLAHHWLLERWLIEPCGGLAPRPGWSRRRATSRLHLSAALPPRPG